MLSWDDYDDDKPIPVTAPSATESPAVGSAEPRRLRWRHSPEARLHEPQPGAG